VTLHAQVADPTLGTVSFDIAFVPPTTTTTVTQSPAEVGSADIRSTEQWKEHTSTPEAEGVRETASAKTTLTKPSDAIARGASSPTGSSGTPGATHIVQVGIHHQTLFRPNQLDAEVGDTVIFSFFHSNHTVSESTLDKPCTVSRGFDTGFNQVSANGTRTPVVAFSVENSAPRWFFCQQEILESHCHAGMVFGLNPGERMDDFLRNADLLAEPQPCRPNDPSNCVEPQLSWNKTEGNEGPGRLPTGPAVVPSRLTSRASRSSRHRAGSLCMLMAGGWCLL
jgi:plastocyanin